MAVQEQALFQNRTGQISNLQGKRQEVRIIKETHTLDLPNFNATRTPMLDIKNKSGFLRSIGFISSPAADYFVQVILDGTPILKRKFSDIVSISSVNADIQAYVDVNGNYVLIIGNLSWKDNFSVGIVPAGSNTTQDFTQIFAIWDEL